MLGCSCYSDSISHCYWCWSALRPVQLLRLAQCNIKLKIGARLPVKCLPTEDEGDKLVATHPSQSRPFIDRVVGGVKYTIAFDEETHHIKYIHTIDRAFRTANG